MAPAMNGYHNPIFREELIGTSAGVLDIYNVIQLFETISTTEC